MSVMSSSSSSPVDSSGKRQSIVIVASAGTVFAAVPPRINPTLTLTLRPSSFSACNATTLWAKSRIALAPPPQPVCAAAPFVTSSMRPMPRRAVTKVEPPSSVGRPHSKTRTRSASDDSPSRISRDVVDPISSSPSTAP
jgi:hypothetical protein